jgi:hypothetical protein
MVGLHIVVFICAMLYIVCTLCKNSLLFYDLSDGEDDDVDDISSSINNSIDVDRHQDASYTLERQGILQQILQH